MRIITGSSGFIGSSYSNAVMKGACVPEGGGVVERYLASLISKSAPPKNKSSKSVKSLEQTRSNSIANPDASISQAIIEGILTGKIINSGTVQEYYEIKEEIRNLLEEERREFEAGIKVINPLTLTLLDQTDTENISVKKNELPHKMNYYRSLISGKFPVCNHNHPFGRIPHSTLQDRDKLYAFFKFCYDTYREPFEIVHMASYGNHSSQREVDATIQANILNTVNLIEVVKNFPVNSLIITGTSSEYGNKKSSMNEGDLLEPDTLYAAAKASQTHLSLYLAREYDLPLVVVRPFSVYGPREADWRFIPTVIKNALYYRILPLAHGYHDWIYVDDYLRGVMLAELFAKDVLKGKIVNIGTGKQYSNRVIVHKLENIMDREIQYELVGKIRSYDKKNWVADATLLRSLGWKPYYTIDSGLEKTYEYYRRKYLIEKKIINK